MCACARERGGGGTILIPLLLSILILITLPGGFTCTKHCSICFTNIHPHESPWAGAGRGSVAIHRLQGEKQRPCWPAGGEPGSPADPSLCITLTIKVTLPLSPSSLPHVCPGPWKGSIQTGPPPRPRHPSQNKKSRAPGNSK